MITAQEARAKAIEAMNTPAMIEVSSLIEKHIYKAIDDNKNFFEFNTSSYVYKLLVQLAGSSDKLETYLELHGYNVVTSSVDGNFYWIVKF